MQTQKIIYPECNKKDFHEGEAVNTICLEPQCKLNSLLCSACVHENHNKHKITSLKLFLHNVNQTFSKLNQKSNQNNENSNEDQTQSKNNYQEVFDFIKQQENESLNKFDQFMEQLNIIGKKIRQQYIDYFESLNNNVKSSDNLSAEFEKINSGLYNQQLDLDNLQQSILKIQDFSTVLNKLIDKQKEQADSNTEEPQNSSQMQQIMKKNIEKQSQTLLNTFQQQEESIQKMLQDYCDGQKLQIVENSSLKSIIQQQKQYQFGEYKHPKLIIDPENNLAISSSEGSAYKVAVIDQELPLTKQKIQFNIKNIGSSNWIGLGVCHRNIIENNQYGFKSSTLGHGAYMISSNSGSWSTYEKSNNQIVKAFSFKKGESVLCEFDPQNEIVNFKNIQTSKKYSLNLDLSDKNNKFYFGIILYSKSDQVEIVNDTQEEF